MLIFKRFSLFFCVLFTGCTLSFNNIATEGHSSDVLDEEQIADPKIDPKLTIPSTVL